MGRVKELLLLREYKEMEKIPNDNLKEYLLTIESEFKPQAYEQDNFYLLKYSLFDLRSLKTMTISEKILNSELEQEIPEQLAKIIHETYFSIDSFNRITYKALINNGWLDTQYLFEAIALKSSISTINDLLILPSSEKAMIYYLSQINDNLNSIWGVLAEHGESTQTTLNNIGKELDLMNYLAQS